MTKEKEKTDALEELKAHQKLVHDQREANAEMVRATIRAQEATEGAEEARKRAEESEREHRAVAEFREMFIGILGHDLRNPLSAIFMTAGQLLESSHLDEEGKKRVARIVNSGRRMSRMISQLLDLTRSRLGGGLPLELKPTDLREICRNVIEEFKVAIRLEVTGDVTGLWDPDRLAEVLSNIVGNAIEHATPNTSITVKAHADSEVVVVEIGNQGEPIPADVLPFIFEPFRQARQRKKSATGNLGLGLYIAREIVLSHGGTLDARSADGRTAFVMRLPRRAPPPHVLIVDADPDIAKGFHGILKAEGHDVRLARTAEEGMRLLAVPPLPDVIILDDDLPILNGPGMAQQMRLHRGGEENIPIVLISAQVDLPEVAARMGTPYFLLKPCDVDALLNLLHRALRERAAPSPA